MRNTFIKISIAAAVILPLGAYAEELKVGDYTITFDQKFEADTNGNGVNDRTSYYQGDQLMWTAYDENENGKADLWFRYKNGDAVDLELYDRDGNGKPDKIAEVDAQEKAEVIYDAAVSTGSSSSFLKTFIILVIAGGVFAALWRAKMKRA